MTLETQRYTEIHIPIERDIHEITKAIKNNGIKHGPIRKKTTGWCIPVLKTQTNDYAVFLKMMFG